MRLRQDAASPACRGRLALLYRRFFGPRPAQSCGSESVNCHRLGLRSYISMRASHADYFTVVVPSALSLCVLCGLSHKTTQQSIQTCRTWSWIFCKSCIILMPPKLSELRGLLIVLMFSESLGADPSAAMQYRGYPWSQPDRHSQPRGENLDG